MAPLMARQPPVVLSSRRFPRRQFDGGFWVSPWTPVCLKGGEKGVQFLGPCRLPHATRLVFIHSETREDQLSSAEGRRPLFVGCGPQSRRNNSSTSTVRSLTKVSSLSRSRNFRAHLRGNDLRHSLRTVRSLSVHRKEGANNRPSVRRVERDQGGVSKT